MKKIIGVLAVLLAAGLVLAGCPDGVNGDGFARGNDKITNIFVEGQDKTLNDFNNAQFHCNTFNGNGRVWPEVPYDFKKFQGEFTFTKAVGTRWNLTKVNGDEALLPVCPKCGSTEWITFSNNSGEPDGKNIQMQHPAVMPGTFIVSFNKVKYGGLLPVFADEFAFDLFSGNKLLGTYYTDKNGTVTVEDLAPGSYVFKERVSIVSNTGLALDDYGYKHVWTANDMAFTLMSNGKIEWAGGSAVLDNVIMCKHGMQYVTQESLGGMEYTAEAFAEYMAGQPNTIPYLNGWLLVGSCGAYSYTIIPATCTRPAEIIGHCDCAANGFYDPNSEGTGFINLWVPNSAKGHDLVTDFDEWIPADGGMTYGEWKAGYSSDVYQWCRTCYMVTNW